MADALTRLVRRAAHPETLARPRPRPPFAPAPVGDSDGAGPATAPAAHERADSTQAPVAVPRALNAGPPRTTGRAQPHPTVAVAAADIAAGIARPPVPAIAAVAPVPPGATAPTIAAGSPATRPVAAGTAPVRGVPARPEPVVRPAQRAAVTRPARPEPVVHVTIGRIEVRAEVARAAPEAPPARERRRVLPLEDYLAARTEGRR